MIDKITTLLILIALGYLSKKTKLISEDGSSILRSLVFNLTLPALVFISIWRASWTIEYLKIPLIVWLSALSLGFLIYLLSRLLGFKKEITAIVVLTGVMGNTTFLGYPMVITILGQEYLPYGIFYDQSSLLFLLSLWVPFVSYIFSNQKRGQGRVNNLIMNVLLKNPPLWAIFAALILRDVPLPGFILDSLNIISQSTTLLVMLYVGTMLNLEIKKEEVLLIGLIIMFKQICFPAVNYLFSGFLGVSPEIISTVMVQSSMPVMVATIIYGGQIGLNVSFISKIVTISTIVSPIFLYLVSSII